jgi:hypothetical protein
MASTRQAHPVGQRTGSRGFHSRRSRLPICLFLVMLVWPWSASADPPDTLWTRTFGGTNIDVGHCIEQVADGGYIVTGYTRSFGSTSGRNVWLVKTDAAGHEEWSHTFGGNGDDEGHAVRQTADGGYIIAGHTQSFGAGMKDVLLIKTDECGDLEWLHTFGGPNDDEGYSVQPTIDGGYIIAGVTSSHGAGSRDVWLIKTDASGNESWSRTHGGMSSDGAWSVQQVSDGGFIMTGWTLSYGPGYLGNAWLVKTDSQGIHDWDSVFGGSGVDRGHAVRQCSDGGYILAGYTDSFGAGLYDMLLVKTDSSGGEQWMKTFGGTGRDYAQSVRQTADGGYIVAGYTLSYGAGSEDAWLVKTDLDGIGEWSQTYGGTSSDVAYCVRQTSDGGYIVAGHTLSYGAGLHDLWLIRLTGTQSGVGETAVANLRLEIANPIHRVTAIDFELPAESGVKLVIHDAAGSRTRTLIDGRLPAGGHSLIWDGRNDAGALVAGGVYFCRIQAGEFGGTRKIVFAR